MKIVTSLKLAQTAFLLALVYANAGLAQSKVVVVPLGDSKSINEPGVAQDLNFTAGSLSSSSTTTLEDVVLMAPAPGYAKVTATFTVVLDHDTGSTDTFAYFNLQETEGNVATGVAWIASVEGNAATGLYRHIVTIHKILEVDAAGPVTYYLTGLKGPVGNVSYDQIYLSAVYFGNAYNSINQ